MCLRCETAQRRWTIVKMDLTDSTSWAKPAEMINNLLVHSGDV